MNRLLASLLVLVPVCSFVAFDGSAAAKIPPYEDNDPGTSGAMQDMHENTVVFSNVAIPKKDGDESKLVSETSLQKPLFVRMFTAKTTARVLNENQQSCDHSMIRTKWLATLEGAPAGTRSVYLREGHPSAASVSSARSNTVLDGAGKANLSLVPQAKVSLPDETDTLYPQFLKLAAQMKPGKNVVTISYEVGCEGQPGKNGKQFTTVSRGQVVFNVKPGDAAAFTKKIGPELVKSMDVAADKRVRPSFEKSLAKGTTLMSFSANATAVLVTKKDTVVSAFVKNADGQCTYTTGHWIEPYASGAYSAGHFETTGTPALIPCP
jgi:hypothetical protein